MSLSFPYSRCQNQTIVGVRVVLIEGKLLSYVIISVFTLFALMIWIAGQAYVSFDLCKKCKYKHSVKATIYIKNYLPTSEELTKNYQFFPVSFENIEFVFR